jgi:hypothetical protein
VSAAGNISLNTITFGNGNADFVQAGGDFSKNAITFGDDPGGFVYAATSGTPIV